MADVQRDLRISGEMAGMEVQQRFCEAGSPAGLRDLEEYLLGRRAQESALRRQRDQES